MKKFVTTVKEAKKAPARPPTGMSPSLPTFHVANSDDDTDSVSSTKHRKKRIHYKEEEKSLLLSTIFLNRGHLRPSKALKSKIAEVLNSPSSPFVTLYGGISEKAIFAKLPELLKDALNRVGLHEGELIESDVLENAQSQFPQSVWYAIQIVQEVQEEEEADDIIATPAKRLALSNDLAIAETRVLGGGGKAVQDMIREDAEKTPSSHYSSSISPCITEAALRRRFQLCFNSERNHVV